METSTLAGTLRVLPRLLVVWVVFAVVLELALLDSGGGGGRTLALFRELAVGERSDGHLWRSVIGSGALSSLGVTFLAIAVTLAFGPALGILMARFRRWPVLDGLLIPVFAAGWLPAFWLIIWGVWWQIEKWRHPGYADAGPSAGGPVWIEPLWRMAQIAGVVALAPIGWHIRSLSEALRHQARFPHVRAARARGVTGSALFYRHIFRGALGDLIRGVDRGLPAMLGAQAVAEWAFRYPGLGRLMIEGARVGDLTGLLGGGLVFGTLVVLIRSAAEMTHAAFDPHPK